MAAGPARAEDRARRERRHGRRAPLFTSHLFSYGRGVRAVVFRRAGHRSRFGDQPHLLVSLPLGWRQPNHGTRQPSLDELERVACMPGCQRPWRLIVDSRHVHIGLNRPLLCRADTLGALAGHCGWLRPCAGDHPHLRRTKGGQRQSQSCLFQDVEGSRRRHGLRSSSDHHRPGGDGGRRVGFSHCGPWVLRGGHAVVSHDRQMERCEHGQWGD